MRIELSHRGRVAAWLACGVLAVVGVFVTLGCLLAGYLELEGFGTPRDTGPRPVYLVSLALGAIAGLAVPTAVSLVLLRGSGSRDGGSR